MTAARTDARPAPTASSPAHVVGLVAAGLAWAVTGSVLLVRPQVPSDRFALVSTTLTVACGVVILLRTDRRPIGWLLVAAGVLWPLATVFFADGPNPPPTTEWTILLTELGELGNSCVLWLLLVFPTGRLDSRLARVGAAIIILVDSSLLLRLVSLLGVVGPVPRPPLEYLLPAFATFIVLGLTMQVRRYRHRPRDEQLQIKWFLFAVSSWLAYPVVLLLDIPVGPVLDVAITATIPVAVLVAITRHRLYEIDRIVSRTLAYVVVLGVLSATFVGGVAGLTALLPVQDDVAVAATTVLVMASFSPLLRRVREHVDRRFDRSRYEARQVLASFGRAVRDETDLDDVRARLGGAIASTVAPATLALWQPATVTSGGAR